MATAASTLGGLRATSARASIPKWGCWYGDAEIDGEVTITGQTELVIADLTLHGTILSGGPAKGRSNFRIVGGAGGWGKTLAKKGYANDGGVKLALVLGDAAREAGETLDSGTLAAVNVALGPSFTRPEGPACLLLEQLAPGSWYVGEDGVTYLGARAAKPLAGTVTHGPVDRARGTVTLAATSIAAILPGLVVDGLTAVDVEHEISPKGGLRSTVWGALASGTSRRLAAWRAIFDQLDPHRAFRGLVEYRVVTQEGERLNLQPIRVSSGMPDLRRIMVRPGVAGAKAIVALGSRVVVGFLDSDPARPVVLAFEDAEGGGFVPTLLSLCDGILPAARMGDLAGPFPIAATAIRVLI